MLKAVSELDRKRAELDTPRDKVGKSVPGEGPNQTPAAKVGPNGKGQSRDDLRQRLAALDLEPIDPAEAAMISRVLRQNTPLRNKTKATQPPALMSGGAGLSSDGALAKEQGISSAEWMAKLNGAHPPPKELHPAFRPEGAFASPQDPGVGAGSDLIGRRRR